jgi:hypothetical protein
MVLFRSQESSRASSSGCSSASGMSLTIVSERFPLFQYFHMCAIPICGHKLDL